jgi:threonine/homoserine/homoserine lactone efflux protein
MLWLRPINRISRIAAMLTSSFLTFLGISILVIVTPGPDTAMTIRGVMLGGRQGGIATAAGVTLGQIVWALATAAGLVAVLLASEPVFQAVKLLGAGYLVYLGARMLWSAWRHNSPGKAAAMTGGPRAAPLALFRQGLISDLGNPKMAVFFASVLPQFASAGQGMFSELALLGVVFSGLTFLWLCLYAVALARLGPFLGRTRIRRSFETIMGSLLIALGMRLAAEQRG